MTDANEAELRDRLRAIGSFRAELEAPDFDVGRWHDSERLDGGDVMTMPWFELSDRAAAFVAALAGIMRPGFDWPTWAQTAEAQALARDRAVLAQRPRISLAKLATAVIREDRFSEGALAESFETGRMVAIARRAEVLARDP